MPKPSVVLLVRVSLPIVVGVACFAIGGSGLALFAFVLTAVGAFFGTVAVGSIESGDLPKRRSGRVGSRGLVATWFLRGWVFLIVLAVLQVPILYAVNDDSAALAFLAAAAVIAVSGGLIYRAMTRRE
jgi:hypothetical protein